MSDIPLKGGPETRAARVPRLALAGITKRYPSVLANDAVDLTVAPGEIHAVLGENGAGKSTLMKIIYGAVRPDAGEISWEGHAVEITSPAAARKLGIGMVFQHFSLFETLTVAENIALALDEPFDLGALARRIGEVSAEYGLEIDPLRHVHSLTVGERQRVEIVRCLLQHPRLLIMDEPTSVLTPQAVRKLFETLRRLAAQGCSILYISHKLDEIQALCDTATVMRAGRVTGSVTPRNETHASLAQLMVGHSLPDYTRRPHTPGEVLLSVQHLTVASDDPFGTSLADVSFDVHAGEIFGIAGVSGNGQAELLAALSGERRGNAARESVSICGEPAAHLAPDARRRLGFAFVPEERLGRGAVPAMTLAENGLLTAHRQARMVRHGWIGARAMHAFAARCIERFDVRCGGTEALAQSLSGGNLQKFIVGREILQAPKVLVVAQPTWGVDVGASAFIRQQLLDLSASGVAVLVVSEELDELFDICDRIAVLAGGRLSPARKTGETNAEEIGRWMAGLFGERGAVAAAEDPLHA
ncbi:ABC transporter ATP-binding protein [Trinickia caryophylli]|uniref:Nucleoside ABC transporter ATP-binding protein n=1 Tax=Trinickia caryophylli TaxID=28094 RepID=A0A1X7DMK4_TRICW|nr:ABC transporter ATP-binding protein [Trinickia caryophylli]PMS10650.1 ABC transporter ATP-binding protein [Trinickia caryophylli]TRX17165.1 ABC transporter ATP-binding protein [Trinickia caryophylli]WQE12101.1 ABC transporter ATP-binding protein [Trinickia caryophylli]SMF18181.1 nucleoside ABC transporter ATP-binding protein [Trinickia caryophylli]GLU31771.1 ABC transporter [Trinickia caryophylli]